MRDRHCGRAVPQRALLVSISTRCLAGVEAMIRVDP